MRSNIVGGTYHAGQSSVNNHKKTPVGGPENVDPVDDEDGERCKGGWDDGVDDRNADSSAISGTPNCCLGPAIEGQKPKEQNKSAQSG